MSVLYRIVLIAVAFGLIDGQQAVFAAAPAAQLPPISARYTTGDLDEVPDFQRHIVPLFGRLGCNGRACHGSFQGRGGFRLSLFGYDFQADHAALWDQESPRVDTTNVLESLIIAKPIDADFHEGGQRYAQDSWQYHVIRRWIEGGAAFDKQQITKLLKLEITPAELHFAKAEEQVQLRVVAVWDDGTREDVTPLCRFQSNDALIAAIDDNGLVTSNERGDTHLVISYDKAVVPIPVLRPVTDISESEYPDVPAPTKVDELVLQKLRKLRVVPSELATDAEFLRRVSLDLTGTLPTARDVEAFLADQDPQKRAKKIDELLETPAYAAWWATKICDFTGNNDQNLNNVSPLPNRPTQDWFDWVYDRVQRNVPYDQLVEGIVVANSLKQGQSYLEHCQELSELYRDQNRTFAEQPAMPFYWARRDFQNNVEARAIAFAYSFMGVRIQCAQCHKHPFDTWSKEDFHQFKNFFARVIPANQNPPREFREQYQTLVKELGLAEKRGNDLRRELPALLRQGKTIPFSVTYTSGGIQRTRNPDDEYPTYDFARLLGGDVVDVTALDEPRQAVMDWLRRPDNIYFAPAFVNRAWASYFNVGIVHPPDDMNLANPPSNKPLLDYLAKGFIDSGFDLKWVHRTIANSRTYQLSWRTSETNRLDERNFSHAIPRRLPAEVAYDALQTATASDAKADEICQQLDGRAIAIAGTGGRNGNNANSDAGFALTVFGRSTRETNCDCDRSMETSLLQTVFLQNDRAVLSMMDVKGGWLDHVARKLSPPSTGTGADQERRVEQLEQQLTESKARLKQLAKQPDNARARRPLERRVAELEKQLEDASNQLAEWASAAVNGEEDLTPIVKEAYLRTVSRYPTDDELRRSLAYVADSDSAVEGVRDLFWALLNTKEFIVNH